MKALIVKKEWLEKIFNDNKTWELRSRNTKIRGKIKLIESGSGTIIGECELVDSIKITEKDFFDNLNKHKVNDVSVLKKWNYAWVIKNARKYDKAIKYNHPKGAVIWVNI